MIVNLAYRERSTSHATLHPLNAISLRSIPGTTTSTGSWCRGNIYVIKAIGNNEERKEITARRHKILTWKTLSNKER
jgi:hypothetical protein